MPTHLFVLGTGRCGTKTLATMLSKIEGVVVEHERPPPLLEEVADYLRGVTGEDELRTVLESTRSTGAIGGRLVSGESNQRLSFILPTIRAVFPEARYLWMIRDGRANVASIHHRRWYDPREARLRQAHHRPSAENRITGPDAGDIAPDEWARMDAFERCCWYWSFTNREIGRRSDELGLETLRVRLEDLGARVDDVLGFLGLPKDTPTELRAWNAARHGMPLETRYWSRSQRSAFERRCGEVMDTHYPGWRERGWDRAPAISRVAHRAAYAIRQWYTVWRIRLAERGRG